MDPILPALGLGLFPGLVALTLHLAAEARDFLQELAQHAEIE